jgi:hypothetical protein
LGGAAATLRGEESPFWNPAGLAGERASRLVLLRSETDIGVSTAATALFSRTGLGSLALSFLQVDAGDQDYTDADDNVVGTIANRDHLAVLTMAREVTRGLDVGVNVDLVHSAASCAGSCAGFGVSSSGVAVDVGMELEPLGGVPLRLGAFVSHLGPRFAQEDGTESAPLPTRLHVGAAYDVIESLHLSDVHEWLMVDLEDHFASAQAPSVHVGSELVLGPSGAVLFRAGYSTRGDGLARAGVGLGIRFDSFALSLAKSVASSSLADRDTDPVNVTFSLGL